LIGLFVLDFLVIAQIATPRKILAYCEFSENTAWYSLQETTAKNNACLFSFGSYYFIATMHSLSIDRCAK